MPFWGKKTRRRGREQIATEAIAALAKGSMTEARALLAEILDTEPFDVRTLLKLADVHVKSGAADSAAPIDARAAVVYECSGFFLKAVAVYKQMLRVHEDLSARENLAFLYARLGVEPAAAQERSSIIDALLRTGREDEAARQRDFLADAVADAWTLGAGQLERQLYGGRFSGHLMTSLASAPVGHRATALALARRSASAVDVFVDASTSRPVALGEHLWVECVLGKPIVPRGNGRYSQAPFVEALSAVLADAMAPLTLVDVIRVAAGLGAHVRFEGDEPPHQEGDAVVFVNGSGRPRRIRVDTLTYGVTATPHG